MNIDQALGRGIERVWTIAASRMKTCVYHAMTTTPYDVATSTSNTTPTDTTVKVFIFDHDLGLLRDGSDIDLTDKRALIPAAHLPEIEGREKCEPGDRITDHKGTNWNVVIVRGDPDFYFDLTIRR
jgi:hypothetical protein